MDSVCTQPCAARAAEDRDALEQLCRYITRPALANERVQINAAGQVVLKLKTAWRDGNTHLVMSPLEFMQRLAALGYWRRTHRTPQAQTTPAAHPNPAAPPPAAHASRAN